MLASGPTYPVLDNELLRTFVAIVETGSFRRAAQRVYRTPSAVSMQIKKLEDTLGRALFRRDAQRVSLTPDGEALLGYGRRMLRLNDEALGRFLGPTVSGLVRLGAPDDFGTRFLPGILARFAATHPTVEVEVVLEPSIDLLARLERGELDLTLVTTGGGNGLNDSGAIVFTEPLVWAGLKGGMAWEREPLPLALSGQGCAWRGAALERLEQAGRRYRIAYSSPHCSGQQAAILADLAIAPFPASLVKAPFRRLGAAENLPPLGNYHIALQRRVDASSAAEVLAVQVEESFREQARGVDPVES